MQTFLLERTVPASFRFEDPDELARHCRWAADGYRRAGAVWLGGVITDAGMFSLVVADGEGALRAYWRSLGVADDDARLRRVLRTIGPFSAEART